MDDFEPWGGRRYNSFSAYLKSAFGDKVWKVSVDAGMGCPNRDGTFGQGGCIFCERDAHSGADSRRPVRQQLIDGIIKLKRSGRARLFIAYFQPGSNTYAPTEALREVFDCIRGFPEMVGLAVGTRPDLVGKPVLHLLSEYAQDYEVWLELGLQSIHDVTLRTINRGHDFDVFLDAYERARRHPLKICVHLIAGLPGEDRKMILETVESLAALAPDGVKLHPLQVLRGTPLEGLWYMGELQLMSLEEYASVACDALELLPPQTTIQRLTAEAPPDSLLAPDWCRDKRAVLAEIDRQLERRDSRQGRLCKGCR